MNLNLKIIPAPKNGWEMGSQALADNLFALRMKKRLNVIKY